MTRILLILLTFLSFQAFSQKSYQDQFYSDQLEMVKDLIIQPHINEYNFIDYIPHSGPIAVSMLRKALYTKTSLSYFSKELIQKLIKTTEKKIFEWDSIEARGQIHIIGEIHNHQQSIHIRNNVIELYKNNKIILGLEGVINNDIKTLEKFDISDFSKELFGLESELNYSVGMLFKYHLNLIEKMKGFGVGSEIADYISNFSEASQYLRGVFKNVSKSNMIFEKAIKNISEIKSGLSSSQNLEKKEIDGIVDLYARVGTELLNRFNKVHGTDLDLYKLKDVIVNYLNSEEKGKDDWNALVEIIVSNPRESDFIYNLQKYISLNMLRKPVVIIVGEAHVDRIFKQLTHLYPHIDITVTKNSSILEDDCPIMEVIDPVQ